MRLWHEKLIPLLPRQQLLGLHRECCALRGNGWGKKHSTVDYVFTHPYEWLVAYHRCVMEEMLKRGYYASGNWYDPWYRGKNHPSQLHFNADSFIYGLTPPCVYPEHDEAYLQECLDNLAQKGIVIERSAIE